MASASAPSNDGWRAILAKAFEIFDDLERRGFGPHPFSLGGGTVLMFRFKHRVSKDIDLFAYDAQWLSLVSPRLNDAAAAVASSYAEQANCVKIVMASGDIDFIVAADVAAPVVRVQQRLEGRNVLLEPTSEILAKKLFYRAASFKARDVYDMSAAIDIDPDAATQAIRAASSKKHLLLRRLDELSGVPPDDLLEGIVPYESALPHAADMITRVGNFVARG